MGASLSLGMAKQPEPGRANTTDTTGVSQTGGDGGTVVQGGATVTGAEPKARTDEEWLGDACGLEDEGSDWEPWEGPKRLRECILNGEEKLKCREILDRVFHPKSIQGVRIAFLPKDVIFVMKRVREYLENEPTLIEDIPYGIQVVGDLHGQLYDLDRIFKLDAKDGKPGWECTKYLLLGNYVDRGRQSLELVMALFCIKMLYPDNVFLLRGNHEFIAINSEYGFYHDFLMRYEDMPTADILYHETNETFAWLSIAAIVGNTYFCAHGGISPSFFTRRQFRGLYKPILNSKDDVLVHDTVWSDPAVGLQGTCFNKQRETSLYFGLDALCYALESIQCLMLVRSHTHIATGYQVIWNCCTTVFSATDHACTKNKGATATIDTDGKIGFSVFEVDPGRAKIERALIKWKNPAEGRAGAKKVVDDVTVVDGGCDTTGIARF